MVGRIMRNRQRQEWRNNSRPCRKYFTNGVPHAEEYGRFEGSAKKRKPENRIACLCRDGAMFVESDAGAILWIAEDQSGDY